MTQAVRAMTFGRRGLRVLRLWCGAIALLLGLGAAAVDASPLATEDTKTLEPGQVELELRGDYAKTEEGALWRLATGVNIGVLPGLEMDVDVPFVLLDPDEDNTRGGVGITLVNVKYRLLDETERRPAFMGAVVLGLPTGDEDFGLGEIGVAVEAIAATPTSSCCGRHGACDYRGNRGVHSRGVRTDQGEPGCCDAGRDDRPVLSDRGRPGIDCSRRLCYKESS